VTDALLTLNAGSSSLKFALFAPRDLAHLVRGAVEPLGGRARLRFRAASGEPVERDLGGDDHPAALAAVFAALHAHLPDLNIRAVGHRIVHGGLAFAAPARIDDDVIATLTQLAPLAPLHQPHNLAAVRAARALFPQALQVACFDTAFHRTQPRIAQLFALPRRLSEDGILRYGFHGLSYEYISGMLPSVAGTRAQGRVIVAHLGHGASMCGIKDRRSIATTMGFTALDGLVMGSRCGALDPGVILHLLQERRMSASDVADLLNNQSGLLGVSGISDDVRDLEKSAEPAAKEALDLFTYRAAREIGSLVAALGGLDVLVFTAGIGEHSAAVRKQICDGSEWLGIRLDPLGNERHAEKISATSSTVDIFVIPTDEEIVIARATKKLVPRPKEPTH
jgi:acetate kinase